MAKAGGVVIDPDVDPETTGGEVIDAVRDGLGNTGAGGKEADPADTLWANLMEVPCTLEKYLQCSRERMMSDVDSHPNDGLHQWLADLYENAEHAEPEIILRELARNVASWDLCTRLAMRTHPVFNLTGFHHHVQKLTLDLGRARDLTRDLNLVRELPRDLARARARELARGLTREFTRIRDLSHDLARDLNLVRDLTGDLDRVRTLALDLVRALDLVLDRAHALERALAHAHALGLTLVYGVPGGFALGLGLSFAQAINRAHDRDHDLYRALTLARDRALTLDRAFDRGGRTKALFDLLNVLSDVTGVDLRYIDLTGISAEGLRWSAGTRWPQQWEDQIRRNSVEIADGIFQVVGSGTAYASIKPEAGTQVV